MQLCQAELFGVFDQKNAGIRHVEADLDEGGCQQDLQRVGDKCGHRLVPLPALQAAMKQPDAERRQDALQVRQFLRHRFDASRSAFFDARINHISLPAFSELPANKRPHLRQCVGASKKRLDPPSARRQLVDDRDIQFAVDCQTQRAGDRRRRHHEQMRVTALSNELLALRHAELVLLVDDDQAEVAGRKPS